MAESCIVTDIRALIHKAISARLELPVEGKQSGMPHHLETGLWIRATTRASSAECWLWRSGAQMTPDSMDASQLQTQGWQRVEPAQYAHQSLCLWGQLAETHLLQTQEAEQLELWARPEDIAQVDTVPVGLVFTLPEGVRTAAADKSLFVDTADVLLVTLDLPPPELGEGGLVAVSDGWQQYTIAQLPEEAQHLQQQLAGGLRALAAAADWWPYTDLLAMCSRPGGYETKRQELRAALLMTQGRAHEQIQEQLAALEVAHAQAESLRTARLEAGENQEVWLAQYRHIQQMAKQLAASYWQIHQSTTRVGRKLPPLNNIFLTKSSTQIPSSLPIQAVLAAYSNAASGASQWRQPAPDRPPTFQYERPAGTTALEVRPEGAEAVLSESTIRSLWEQVRRFSDLDGDAFLAALAQAMAAPADEDGYVWITGSQVLDYRGIRPIMKREGATARRAGHRQEDLADVAACFGRMSNTWVTIRQSIEEARSSGKRKRPTKRLYTHQSRLMQIAEVIQQHELSGEQQASATSGSSIAIAWRYQPGTWLKPFLEGPNRQMTWLFQQVLRYDPHNEQWEKRLARYFMFHLRINSAGGGAAIVRRIGTLITELSLPVDQRNPGRTMQRFERAMEQLQRDQQIDSWQYVEGNPALPPRGWLETWLSWSVRVSVAALTRVPAAAMTEAIEAPRTRAEALKSLKEEQSETPE